MDGLYFPWLSLPSSTWVKPALLFFDRLAVVAPPGQPTLFDDRTRELIDLDLVRSVTPNGDWSREADEAFVGYILGKASSQQSTERIDRLHVGKLIYTPSIRQLVRMGLLTEVDHSWLEGPDWVVAHVMAYLASQMSMHSVDPLALVTDDRAASLALFGTNRSKAPRRAQAIARLLRVPPHARPQDIRRFRDRHRGELEAFRNFVTELISIPPGEDFEQHLASAQEVRDHLKGEMAAFNWKEDGPTIAVAAAATGACFAEGSYLSTAVGLLGLIHGGALAADRFNRLRAAANDPLAFATRAIAHWPPSARDAL